MARACLVLALLLMVTLVYCGNAGAQGGDPIDLPAREAEPMVAFALAAKGGKSNNKKTGKRSNKKSNRKANRNPNYHRNNKKGKPSQRRYDSTPMLDEYNDEYTEIGLGPHHTNE